MAIVLRNYQLDAVSAIEEEWAQGRLRTILSLPTGCGKTIVFSEVAKREVERGGRVLILAHRGELLDQAADKIKTATGLLCSVEKAEQHSLDSWCRITVGSVQTLMRESRLKQFESNYFSLLIVDECHHAVSDSYQKVLQHFKGARVLGVSATIDRGDKKTLSSYFDSVAYDYSLLSAISNGYLSPIKALTVPLDLDLRGVKVTAGDYNASALGNALEPYLEAIAEEMKSVCFERKTVVFLPLISTSQKFCELLQEHGFNAREVNGESQDRAQTLKWFNDAGAGSVLCNSMLLTEGWDCPSVDCIIVLRPTKIRSLYCQMVGRGTRLFEGKEELLILDFLWHTERHQLCRPANLVSDNEKVTKIITEKLAQENAAIDLEDVLTETNADVAQEREQSLAKQIEENKRKKRKFIDPIQFEMSIADSDLMNWEPTFMWELAPASQKQLDTLANFGIDINGVECAGKASQILDRLFKRKSEGLSTARQIKCLERYGFNHVGQWKFEDANALIGKISNNGWKVPTGIDIKTYRP